MPRLWPRPQDGELSDELPAWSTTAEVTGVHITRKRARKGWEVTSGVQGTCKGASQSPSCAGLRLTSGALLICVVVICRESAVGVVSLAFPPCLGDVRGEERSDARCSMTTRLLTGSGLSPVPAQSGDCPRGPCGSLELSL